MKLSHEPVGAVALVTAAITSTIALLAFVGVSQEAIGAITATLGAWVLVAAYFVRSRVAPVVKLEDQNEP